jgi:hypothetical protein
MTTTHNYPNDPKLAKLQVLYGHEYLVDPSSCSPQTATLSRTEYKCRKSIRPKVYGFLNVCLYAPLCGVDIQVLPADASSLSQNTHVCYFYVECILAFFQRFSLRTAN